MIGCVGALSSIAKDTPLFYLLFSPMLGWLFIIFSEAKLAMCLYGSIIVQIYSSSSTEGLMRVLLEMLDSLALIKLRYVLSRRILRAILATD